MTPGATPVEVARLRPAQANLVVPGLVLPPRGVLVAQWAPVTLTTAALGGARWGRHLAWCDRTGTTTAPAGMGHYDFRAGSLVSAVGGPTGVGLSGLVLTSAPAQLMVRLEVLGVPASAVLSLRLDFLDQDRASKTVTWRDPASSATNLWPTLTEWPASHPTPSLQLTSLLGGATVPIGLDAQAPTGWATSARRVRLSVLVAGSPTPATVRLTLN